MFRMVEPLWKYEFVLKDFFFIRYEISHTTRVLYINVFILDLVLFILHAQ